MTRTIGRPYLWLCEGDPCKRLRFDRYGQARNLRALEIGPDDPGEGQRYHPECHPQPRLWDRLDVPAEERQRALREAHPEEGSHPWLIDDDL